MLTAQTPLLLLHEPADEHILMHHCACCMSCVVSACRGGPLASAHVEALSNVNLMRDVLKVVAGIGHTLEDDLSSDVPKIAEQIHCFDDDTC